VPRSGIKWLLLCGVACAGPVMLSAAGAQGIQVGPAVPISPPGAGWHNWTVIDADPSDARNLIVCGDRWLSHTNALSGFVYASRDNGWTWKLAVEDARSSWVSEETCAFGLEGRAYFFAGATKVYGGRSHHEEGEMRLYVSTDHGTNWNPALSHDWADHGAIAVERPPNPHGGRLYVFHNARMPPGPDGIVASTVGLLTSDDQGTSFGPLVRAAPPAGVQYRGTYPTAAHVLDNGTAIAVYYARRVPPGTRIPRLPGESIIASTVEAVSTSDGGRTLNAPVVVAAARTECGGSTPDLAVDRSGGTHHRRLYVVYGDSSSGTCQSFLAHSSDDGKSWSKPSAVDQAGDSASVHVAVNRNGAVGLFWRDRLGECWRFAASRDGGRTFSAASEVSISGCSSRVKTGTGFVQPYLMTVNVVDGLPNPDALDQLGFSVRTTQGSVWKNSMTVGPDGAFHPVWMANGEAGGQIWTTAIIVDGPAPVRSLGATAALEDISKSIAFDFANQQYDEGSDTLSIDVALINKATTPIFGPLRLELSRVTSAAQSIEVSNADNGLTAAGAAWNLTELVDQSGLAPGATTIRRRRLEFRARGIERRPAIELLVVQAKMFGKTHPAR
jgi:hypothetical protein